ncbi:MAG: hypothetical protein IPI35_33735 [Deltaproteobacteria bacterium]|nr:hypothetical protein [Deltaproteobacteria bacterium]
MRSHAILAALLTGAAVWSPAALAQDSDTFNFSGDTFDSQDNAGRAPQAR